MISKEDVQELLNDLKKMTGKGQEEISVLAGYKPKTLTQLLSKGGDLESAYTTLKLLKTGLNKSTNEIDLLREIMAEKDARRQDAERTISLLERIINSGLIEIKANLKEANESLQAIEAQQGVEHNMIMGSLDRLEKRKPGTLAAESGTLELEVKNLKNKKNISTP